MLFLILMILVITSLVYLLLPVTPKNTAASWVLAIGVLVTGMFWILERLGAI